MGAGRPFKCPICLKNVKKEDGVEYNKKHYHRSCYSTIEEIKKVKKPLGRPKKIVDEIKIGKEKANKHTLSICPLCLKDIIKNDGFEYKGKHYHESCFAKLAKEETKLKIKTKKEKQKIEQLKKSIQKETHIQIETDISDEEIITKDLVFNYLKKLLNVSKLNVKIYKLLKDYYTIYKFSYKGMLITLKYFYEIQNNPVISDCVGIIPYIYAEAQEYEQNKNEIIKYASDLDMSKVVIPKVIKIKKNIENNYIKLIDINKLR